MSKEKEVVITALSTINAAGENSEQTFRALTDFQPGLRRNDFNEVNLWIGRVPGVEEVSLPENLRAYDCRNNRLAYMGLHADGFHQKLDELKSRVRADRIGLILGTTTSGILETELAYNNRDDSTGEFVQPPAYREAHNLYSLVEFVKEYTGIKGISHTISTACSSSTKVFVDAQRLLKAGRCDAVVVGGVDSLCYTTLHGFASLEIVSERACRPCSADRNGISIGEAAGFAIVEFKEPAPGEIIVSGYGESSDAYHMSTPHPDGEGALLAMQGALDRSGLSPSDIDYIHMHGTGTPANDVSEDRAIYRLFQDRTPASSTKSWTGHTLGAAGITSVAVSVLCLKNDFIPGIPGTEEVDPAFQSRIVLKNQSTKVRRVMLNSFGFGGSNCSLVLERVE